VEAPSRARVRDVELEAAGWVGFERAEAGLIVGGPCQAWVPADWASVGVGLDLAFRWGGAYAALDLKRSGCINPLPSPPPILGEGNLWGLPV
jgi:hypothetical protein